MAIDPRPDDDVGDDIIYDEDFAATSVSPTHDANGNLTEGPMYKYTYDAWNRVVNVASRHDTVKVTVADYDYDGTGRRIKKVVSNAGDRDGTEYYYYAGQQMIETRNGSETATQQFVFGTQYVDEPIALIDNPGVSETWYFHHQDANYNVTLLTDDTGLETEYYQYTPYGELSVHDGDYRPINASSVANPFTYTGRFHDVETGLYYYRARHYHPSLGRFVQRDPDGQLTRSVEFSRAWPATGVAIAPSVLQTLWADEQYRDGAHLYQYVRTNPLTGTDPTGLRRRRCTDGCRDPGTVSFCFCINRCRIHGSCAATLVQCLAPGAGIASGTAKCIVGCAPTLLLPPPAGICAYKICTAACGGISGFFGLYVDSKCIQQFQACAKSANEALERCLAGATN